MSIFTDTYEVLHRIRVRFYPNSLPSLKGTYIARTGSDACLTIEQICSELKNRGGYTGSYEDLVMHVRMFFDEAAYQLCDGYAVNTGYFSIHPYISGAFTSTSELYDPKKHPILFRFRTRKALQRLARAIKVEIVGPADTNGLIDKFYDVETGSTNETVTSGGLFNISGPKIKVTGDDPLIGVYFISSENPENEVKVTATLAQNTANKLTGVIPQLTSGLWKVMIKTQFNGSSSSILKKPRTMISDFELNAVEKQTP